MTRISSIAKSYVLATTLVASSTPISVAFTSPSGSYLSTLRATSLSSSSWDDYYSSYNSNNNNNEDNNQNSNQNNREGRRQRLRDSQQQAAEQQQYNSNNNNIDFPSSSSSSQEENWSFLNNAANINNHHLNNNQDQDNDNNNDEPRTSEFHNLEPLPQSPTRRIRLEHEARSLNIYTQSGSNPYWDLQDEISQLQTDLQTSLDVGVSDSAVNTIRDMLRRAQSRDPNHVYQLTKGAAYTAEGMGKVDESHTYMEECMRARKMLPQFNLEGLWVGKYGSHGFEMINVTYSGDQLIAYKVTGDQNIPRGEITFTADLSSPTPVSSDDDMQHPGGYYHNQQQQQHHPSLDPILLSESSAKKWGTKRLPRFPGHGHAAEPGYLNHQYMDGQLVVIGEGNYFSFAWVPLEHQIFFGRPSPELTLKMLREGGGSALTAGIGLNVPGLDDNVRDQTEYALRCLEVTSDTFFDELNEGKVSPFSCIWHGDDVENCYFE